MNGINRLRFRGDFSLVFRFFGLFAKGGGVFYANPFPPLLSIVGKKRGIRSKKRGFLGTVPIFVSTKMGLSLLPHTKKTGIFREKCGKWANGVVYPGLERIGEIFFKISA